MYNVMEYMLKEGAAVFCLKCGNKIGEKAVFCEQCLKETEHYPVKPDAKIFLPPRTAPSITKKAPPRRKSVTPEEKISRMRKAIQILSIVLAASLIALALSVALLLESMSTETQEESIGQNYGTIDHKY